ncbi:hypothetical protein V8E55_008417 [Tylopilus felleus]
MVDIYLNYREPPKAPFLSVPNSDIERLSNRPLRWLRYVMFSICGARGDLFRTLDPTDDPVDYNTSLADLSTVIYYKPSEDCIFVDYEGFDDRITSTNQTFGRAGFRRIIIRRDGSCVVTKEPAGNCDAAHLIPWSKGDEYIAKVVRLRSRLYSTPPSISGINDVQNGMLLNATLHRRLGRGEVAFIKTPNYGLEPSDIKRLDLGPPCTDHITFQQLVKPKGDDPHRLTWRGLPGNVDAALAYGAHLDVQFRGSPLSSPPSLPPPPPSRPPALILDYAYDVAAFKAWRSRQGGEVHAIMRDYRDEQYAHISPLPRQVDDSDDEPAADDPDGRPQGILLPEKEGRKKDASTGCINPRCHRRRSRSGDAVHMELEDILRKELAATNGTLELYLVEVSRSSFSESVKLSLQ